MNEDMKEREGRREEGRRDEGGDWSGEGQTERREKKEINVLLSLKGLRQCHK